MTAALSKRSIEVDLPIARNDEIAVAEAVRSWQASDWVVESVESENQGFDLISRRPHPEDAKTFTDVRFIEMKGRVGVGVIPPSENEYRTAQRLREITGSTRCFTVGGRRNCIRSGIRSGLAGSQLQPWNITAFRQGNSSRVQ